MKIQLFLKISILLSIVLKRWNFPDNLNFKGKILTHSFQEVTFSKYEIIWQENKLTMEPFKKHVTFIKALFIPFTYITFYSITSSVLFTKNNANYGMREKRFCVCMAASVCHVVSKEVENSILDTIAFLDPHICVNKPYWHRRGIIIFLCKYIVISDTLIGSWMCFSCCSL